MDCPGVIVPCCLISEEEVASAIKELRVGKCLVILVWWVNGDCIWWFWYNVDD